MRGAAPRPPVALVTYSTKPRGGVVHTLHLAEALERAGQPVHVFALGDPGAGFFRPVRVPHTIIPAPPQAPLLEERVSRSVDALFAGLSSEAADRFPILHVQDCIAARAATRIRDEGADVRVIRTVHHVDDFTTEALIECQRRSILDPDLLLVVSQYWRRLLRNEYGVDAAVVTNGVDHERFARPARFDGAAMRARVKAEGRFLFLTVGGIEPRKNSLAIVEALARLRESVSPSPRLAIVGAHSFQDHTWYLEMVLARAEKLGLEIGTDLTQLGMVPDAELPDWYHAADAFVFPSVREGWGIAVLEAMSAGLPVIASDIPVFREYLQDGRGALLVPPDDRDALTTAMARLATDPQVRASLGREAPGLAARFTWQSCARRHMELYRAGLVDAAAGA